MKIFTNILFLITLIFIVANLLKLDYINPLKGDSMIALISLTASLCAFLLLLIFRMSKKIENKLKK
jgi:hypothetical protein